jgi:hypothetical protein
MFEQWYSDLRSHAVKHMGVASGIMIFNSQEAKEEGRKHWEKGWSWRHYYEVKTQHIYD